jgi:uncharacterized protein YpmB
MRRKTVKRRKWWKITLASIAVLGAAVFGAYRFYTGIQKDIWQEKAAAVQTATEKTDLAEADKVEPFVGDKAYMTVQGKAKNGRSMVVWLSDNGVHEEYADTALTVEGARSKTLQHSAKAEILRITPAVFENRYAWQVFYQVKGNGGTAAYYDFYDFHNGELLDTWTLTLRQQ